MENTERKSIKCMKNSILELNKQTKLTPSEQINYGFFRQIKENCRTKKTRTKLTPKKNTNRIRGECYHYIKLITYIFLNFSISTIKNNLQKWVLA